MGEGRGGRVSGLEPLRVACAARRDYVPHAAAMLDSVLGQSSRPLEVHFLHGADLRARARSRLGGMIEARGAAIDFHEVSAERVRGLRTIDFLPASHWYRIFLPELLADVDRILYLDADTIAVDSLDPLWETELGSHPVAAVTNVFQHDHVDHPRRIGLARPDSYFNTGVMLLSLEALRREDAPAELWRCAHANRERLGFPEQDAMNLVIGERRLPLHPRWNAMNSVLQFDSAASVLGSKAVAEARESPAIRHFEGPGVNKPWHLLCDRPDRELYAEHRRRTPWPRIRPAGITPANLARWLGRRIRG